MRKIVHIVTVAKSVNLMKDQLKFLRENGYSPLVVSSPGKQLDALKKNEKINIKPVEMEREINIKRDLKSFFNLIVLLSKEKPLLSNVSTPKAGLLGGVAAYITRVPCRIYTVRGLRFETTKGIKRKILIAMERISCYSAHEVICISPSLKEKVIDFKLTNEKKVRVLAHGSSKGLDLRSFPERKDVESEIMQLSKKVGISLEKPVIGFVGRLTKDKGIEELIRAFKILKESFPEIQLLIVGEFEYGDSVSSTIKKEIEKNKSIYETGFVNNPNLYYYLMDVFIFPTHREGFGNVSIEAAAAQVPVITTNATGAIDTVEDNKSGFIVSVGDYRTMAKKAEELLRDKQLRIRMGKHGRDMVRRKFKPEFIWEELQALYDNLIDKKVTK